MLRQMCLVIVFDFIIMSIIVMFVIPRASETKDCSSELYWAGMALCIYLVFFVVRNIFIMVCCFYSKNPNYRSTISRIGCVCVDCFAFTTVVIWATNVLVSDEAQGCKDTSEPVGEFWWCLLTLIICGYLQIFFEWLLCLVTSCLVCVYCCIYISGRREERAVVMQRF